MVAKRWEKLILPLILLLAALIRLPSLSQPLGPDQGNFAVIGEGILRGLVPYRDLWDFASPAIFFTYALIFKLLGRSMIAIPLADLVVNLGTTIAIYALTKRLYGKDAGYVAALLYAIFSNGVSLGMNAAGTSVGGTFWFLAQRETFMAPLIVFGIYLCSLAKGRESKDWLLVGSGFLLGLSVTFKITALLILPWFLIFINELPFISQREKKGISLLIRRNLFLALGFLVAIIPFLLFFLFHQALDDLIEATLIYSSSVYAQVGRLFVLKRLLMRTLFIVKENFILWLFPLTAGLYLVVNERTRVNLLVLLWSLLSFAMVMIQGEFFGYHYLIVLPSLSLLAGYGIVKSLGPALSLREIFSRDMYKAFIILVIMANLLIFTSLNYKHYTRFFYLLSGRKSWDWYYQHFSAYPQHEYSFPADYEVVTYLNKNTDPKDYIFICGGIETEIYFLTQRRSPTRFVFNWFLFNPETSGKALVVKYRGELLQDLKTRRPKYILVINPLEGYQSFPEIHAFIAKGYLLERTFPQGRFLYRRNEG